MSFTTYIPSDILKPFVKSFAISENEKADSYKVLPGTSIVMGFQYSGALSLTKENKSVKLNTAGITGLIDRYRIFNNSANIGTVLVMFSETGAASFFKTPMHELFGQSLSLDDLIIHSQMDVVVEKLSEVKTDIARINVVESFLKSLLSPKVNDELVTLAVNFIEQSGGTIKMNLLAEKLNISQSQFEKRFRKIVGATPKKFASIVRLRSMIDTTPKNTSLTELSLDAGYYDQSHFIKDFK